MLFVEDIDQARERRESDLLLSPVGRTDSASISSVRGDLATLVSHGYLVERAAPTGDAPAAGTASAALPWDRVLRATSAGVERFELLLSGVLAQVADAIEPPSPEGQDS